ncbi:hypothetical protein KEM60_03155 [Austwickia sp. TVS 96-490-7B]|nr:hypothetical protein [Austwickia sp. TVS 96-490-7B]
MGRQDFGQTFFKDGYTIWGGCAVDDCDWNLYTGDLDPDMDQGLYLGDATAVPEMLAPQVQPTGVMPSLPPSSSRSSAGPSSGRASAGAAGEADGQDRPRLNMW